MTKYKTLSKQPLSTAKIHQLSPLAIASALLIGGFSSASASAQTAGGYQEQGQIGNAASWRSDEFQQNWGLGAIGAEYAYARGLSGKGMRLGIIDSGVAFKHSEFLGKDNIGIFSADRLPNGALCPEGAPLSGPGACFVADGSTVAIEEGWLAPIVYNDHGTHVAGIMLANRDGGGMHGVAYDASVVVARDRTHENVLLNKGETLRDTLENMVARGVRAVNLSLPGVDYNITGGSPEADTAEKLDQSYQIFQDELQIYTDVTKRHGLLHVWAAGNEGSDFSPGPAASLPRWEPELEKYWLSVVMSDQQGLLDENSNMCGLSKNWCVTAPGTDIKSSIISGEIEGEILKDEDGNSIGLNITAQSPEYGYASYSGTSQAAPQVAGALALLFERFPYLDNAQVRDVLLTTATDLGAPGVDEIYGWGLINLKKAIDGPGQMRVDTDVVMNQHAGGTKVWEGLAWDDWRNDIGGPGRLSKSGVGWLRLSGNNSFAGLNVNQGVLELNGNNTLSADVQVNGGLFLLNGALTNTALTVNGGQAHIQGRVDGGLTRIAADGRLSGTGTLSDTVVQGTISPVSANGALRVAGNYTQAPGSNFELVTARANPSAQLDISGQANLQGGTVRVIREETEQQPVLGKRYALLTAADGVTGQFDGLDTNGLSLSPFLGFGLAYNPTQAYLQTIRGMALADAAHTRNQRAVGAAIDSMGDDQPLAQSVTQLFPQQALGALDRLSGEIVASTHSVLIDESRHLRDAALLRARMQPHGAASNNAETGATAWAQILGNRGYLQSDANAGRINYSAQMLMLGLDHQLDNGLRLGALGAIGRNTIQQPAGAASNDADAQHIGLYLAQTWDGFGLRAGLGYARYDVKMKRSVTFPGVQNDLTAKYKASSTQAFVEGAHRWANGAWEWEPFVQLAQVNVKSNRFDETGGIAALSGQAQASKVNLSTLGVRFNVDLQGTQKDDNRVGLHGSVSRRFASGDLTPSARMAWNTGSTFEVSGAPVARDAILLEAGITAQLNRTSLFQFGYSSSLANKASDHGLNFRYSYNF